MLGAQDADCVPPRVNPRGLRGGGSIFFWVRGSDMERQKLGTGLLAGETSVNRAGAGTQVGGDRGAAAPAPPSSGLGSAAAGAL